MSHKKVELWAAGQKSNLYVFSCNPAHPIGHWEQIIKHWCHRCLLSHIENGCGLIIVFIEDQSQNQTNPIRSRSRAQHVFNTVGSPQIAVSSNTEEGKKATWILSHFQRLVSTFRKSLLADQERAQMPCPMGRNARVAGGALVCGGPGQGWQMVSGCQDNEHFVSLWM